MCRTLELQLHNPKAFYITARKDWLFFLVSLVSPLWTQQGYILSKLHTIPLIYPLLYLYSDITHSRISNLYFTVTSGFPFLLLMCLLFSVSLLNIRSGLHWLYVFHSVSYLSQISLFSLQCSNCASISVQREICLLIIDERIVINHNG